MKPLASEKFCPKPGADHSAPFHPLPDESLMPSVQLAPMATSTGEVEEYGAPPFSVVPSVQLRPQLISPGSLPGEHAMSEVTVVDIRGAGSAEDKLVAQTEFGLGCRRCSKCGGVIRLYRVARETRLTHTCTVHDASCSAVCQPLLVCVSCVH